MKYWLKITVLAVVLVITPILFIWLHHRYISGLNPVTGLIFTCLMLIFGALCLMIPFFWVARHKHSISRISPTKLFGFGCISWFILGLTILIIRRHSTLGIHLRDTYYIIENVDLSFWISLCFGLFACIYHWFPLLVGRQMNHSMVNVHFFITFLGAIFIFFSTQALAPWLIPQYANHGGYNVPYQLAFANQLKIATILLSFAQLIFVFNLLHSFFKGRKVNFPRAASKS